MEDNEFIATRARKLIGDGMAIVLATIIDLAGSSPRHIGAKMLVDASGRSHGTIGGSLLEAYVIEECSSVLKNRKSRFVDFDLSGKDATAAGMICGGKARVFLDYLPADSTSLDLFRAWQETALTGKSFFFLTHVKEDSGGLDIMGRYILASDGRISGTRPCSLPDAGKLQFEVHNMNSTEVVSSGETKIVVNCIRKLKTVYCFGGGHVAVPTAHIAAMVGFKVFVMDDRAEYASAERFPEASSIRVIEDFERAFEGLEIDGDSFIVIVTRGHQYDREVLEQALGTSAGYIGMISSRKKRDAIYENLMGKGITQEQLAKVHSPIGLDIGGETPEEIAVSIVSELISERSKQTRGK